MIHQRARRAREEKNLSQQSLATLAGVPRSQLQLFEQGGNVTRQTVEKLLAPLGLTLVAVSEAELSAARAALQHLDAFLGRLSEALPHGPETAAPDRGGDKAPAGATRHVSSGIDDETRARIAAIDAMVDRGDIKTEDDS